MLHMPLFTDRAERYVGAGPAQYPLAQRLVFVRVFRRFGFQCGAYLREPLRFAARLLN
jgi:hypothetical protein